MSSLALPKVEQQTLIIMKYSRTTAVQKLQEPVAPQQEQGARKACFVYRKCKAAAQYAARYPKKVTCRVALGVGIPCTIAGGVLIALAITPAGPIVASVGAAGFATYKVLKPDK